MASEYDVVSLRDSNARVWLIETTARRTLQEGRRVEVSEIPRRVFALGRSLVERNPKLLDKGKEQ